jgi:probable F420-dependent oxidoreductase
MKVRIGVGAGRTDLAAETLGDLADDLVELGFDSIWLSEVLTGGGLDPLVGLAYVAAHNARLKLGTTMLLPGRNPVRLAKALASLDRLSNGRLLVTMVPGLADEPERSAIGLEPRRRAAAIDEVMPLLRELWSGEVVSHEGAAANFSDVRLTPLPVQQPLELWLGGMAHRSLVRCGQLGDGWLPSFCTPTDALEGRRVIDEAADAAERSISPEHFGVSIAYARQPLDDAALSRLRRRARGDRPAPELPVGVKALRSCLEAFLEVGFSKFVVRPLALTVSWRDELEELAAGVGDLQT